MPSAIATGSCASNEAAMESAVKIAVPLPVELGAGENWMDAKP